MLYEQLTIKGSNCSSVAWQEQVTFQRHDDDIYFVLDQQAVLIEFLMCYLAETTVCGYTCYTTHTHFTETEYTSLWSYSLMLYA